MSKFIQLHFLTSYPPSNLNRDDLGRPKTAQFGDGVRLRISSQSLKRAWRTSDIFADMCGVRTRTMEAEIAKVLGAKDSGENCDCHEIFADIQRGDFESGEAKSWAKFIVAPFYEKKTENGKQKSKKNSKDKDAEDMDTAEGNEDKNKTEKDAQLVHYSIEEIQNIKNLLIKIISEKKSFAARDEFTPLKNKLLMQGGSTVDIACFGRMLANRPDCNAEAAVQVAHAITVHRVAVEDDFFTAVDDLNNGEEDSGAGHLGSTEFAAGLFYNYICIDQDQLRKNLTVNSKEWAQKTIAALIEAAAKVAPSGKQNSFASRAYASYILAEKGNQQPRSLAVAFLKSVDRNDLLKNAIKALEEQRAKINEIYGKCADQINIVDVSASKGSLQDLINFAIAE